jgi:hypothetical protein
VCRHLQHEQLRKPFAAFVPAKRATRVDPLSHAPGIDHDPGIKQTIVQPKCENSASFAGTDGRTSARRHFGTCLPIKTDIYARKTDIVCIFNTRVRERVWLQNCQ